MKLASKSIGITRKRKRDWLQPTPCQAGNAAEASLFFIFMQHPCYADAAALGTLFVILFFLVFHRKRVNRHLTVDGCVEGNDGFTA